MVTAYTINTGDLWNNGYPNTGTPLASTFSYLKFTTDATSLMVTGTTQMYASFSSFAHLGLKIDGVVQTPFVFTNQGEQIFSRAMFSGEKSIELINGAQSLPPASGFVLGSYISGLSIESGTYFNLISPSSTNRILVYGDSIAGGANATNAEYSGWTPLLHQSGYNMMSEAWGFRTLRSDADTVPMRIDFANRLISYAPTYLYMAIGTNDAAWTTGGFTTAYAGVVDAFHSGCPNSIVFCQSPLQRSVDTSFFTGIRDGISGIAVTRPYCVYVNGGDYNIVTANNIADGVHPTTSGQGQYAAFVYNLLQSYPFAAEFTYRRIGRYPKFFVRVY